MPFIHINLCAFGISNVEKTSVPDIQTRIRTQDLFPDRPPDTECHADQNWKKRVSLYCFKSSICFPAFGFRMMFAVPLTCLTGLEQLPGFHTRRTLPPHLAFLPFFLFIFLEIAG